MRRGSNPRLCVLVGGVDGSKSRHIFGRHQLIHRAPHRYAALETVSVEAVSADLGYLLGALDTVLF